MYLVDLIYFVDLICFVYNCYYVNVDRI